MRSYTILYLFFGKEIDDTVESSFPPLVSPTFSHYGLRTDADMSNAAPSFSYLTHHKKIFLVFHFQKSH
jgi:hypothetical protein